MADPGGAQHDAGEEECAGVGVKASRGDVGGASGATDVDQRGDAKGIGEPDRQDRDREEQQDAGKPKLAPVKHEPRAQRDHRQADAFVP